MRHFASIRLGLAVATAVAICLSNAALTGVIGGSLAWSAEPDVAKATESEADKLEKGAAERTAAQLLPSTTVVYAEIARPKQLVDQLLNHPSRKRLEELDAYRAAILSPQYLKFQFGLAIAETALGMPWREAVETLAGGGIFLGFDGKTQGGAVLVRSTDAKKLAEFREKLFNFARADARKNSRPDPIQEVAYRGVKAYKVAKGFAATIGPWLLVTNNSETGKAVIDQLVDATDKTLASAPEFLRARESMSGEPVAWTYLDTKALRDANLLFKALAEKSGNPALELLAGGLLANLASTPYHTAALFLDAEGIRLVAATPHDPKWVAKPREFYFGPEGKGRAPKPLVPPKGIALSLVTHRDISGMWLAGADLFDEKANAELSQADSGLSTLFGGKEFSRDILGAFEPDWQFILARQDFGAKTDAAPEIKLPAGAIVFRMKDPAKMRPQLKVTFQSVVGFLNITGGMNGFPPLDLNNERRGEDLIVSSEYMMENTAEYKGKMFHNFSPSVAMVGDRFIIASTKQLADALATSARTPAAPSGDKSPAASPSNTDLGVDLAVVGQMLDDNRAQLVAQNMLEKGHDRKQAEAEIKMLTDILGLFQSARLKLAAPNDRLELELRVKLAQ